MINFFRNLFDRAYNQNSVRDIVDGRREVIWANTKSEGGIWYHSPTGVHEYNSNYENIKRKLVMDWLQKWEYTCDDDFNWVYLEKLLMVYGRALIFKQGEEIIITSFVPRKWNYNFIQATVVSPIYFNENGDAGQPSDKRLKVGEDCVIVFNDESNPYMKTVRGPLVINDNLIVHASNIYSTIIANTSLMTSKLVLEGDMSPEHIRQVERDLKNPGQFVVRLGQFKSATSSTSATQQSQFKSKDSVIQFDDRTPVLWYNFDRIMGELKEAFGISNNVNPGKKERTTNMELEIDSTVSDAINNHQLTQREKMVKDLAKIGITVSVKLRETEQINEMENPSDANEGEENDE